MVNYILIHTLRSGGAELVNILLQPWGGMRDAQRCSTHPGTAGLGLGSHCVLLEEPCGIFPNATVYVRPRREGPALTRDFQGQLRIY